MNSPDPRTERANNFGERYRRALWYISFTLCMLYCAALFAVTVRCYIPYGFLGFLPPSVRVLLFAALVPCAVLITLSLWLSNILIRKLRPVAVIGVFALSCVVVCIPFLFSALPWRTVSYPVSAYVFFMLPLALAFVFASLFSGKTKKCGAGAAVAALCVLPQLIAAGAVIYALIRSAGYALVALLMCLPVLSLLSAGSAFAASFFGVFTRLSMIRQFTSLGLGALICAFRGMDAWACAAFAAVLVINCAMLFPDIVRYASASSDKKIPKRTVYKK